MHGTRASWKRTDRHRFSPAGSAFASERLTSATLRTRPIYTTIDREKPVNRKLVKFDRECFFVKFPRTEASFPPRLSNHRREPRRVSPLDLASATRRWFPGSYSNPRDGKYGQRIAWVAIAASFVIRLDRFRARRSALEEYRAISPV